MPMTRRFFVVFFMYFFVIQSAIFGIVRAEPKFYAIWLINFVFIVLMALFYSNFDKWDKNSSKHDDMWVEKVVHKYHNTLNSSKKSKTPFMSYLFVFSIVLMLLAVLSKALLGVLSISIWRFAWFYFIMLFLSAKKMLDKRIALWKTIFLPKDFLFWTSIILVIGVYGTLPLQIVTLKVLLAVFVWAVFFFIWASIVKEVWSSNVFKMYFTKLYLVILWIFVLLFGFQVLVSGNDIRLSSDLQRLQIIVSGWLRSEVWEKAAFTWKDLLSNWEWEVLLSSLLDSGYVILDETGSTIIDTWDVSSDVIPNNNSTWIIQDIIEEEDVIVEDARLSLPTYPTMMDALIYLMDYYNVELYTKKDITFTYVSVKNPYYTEFRTAYEKRLIWKNTNPSKRVLCETYIVMKWLLEWWEIDKTLDIKSAYRKKAVSSDQLNDCKWWFYAKNINL